MSTTTRARFRAAIVAIAPAVLLFAFVYHPYIANLTDKAAVAAALASDTTRWGLSHLAVGVGSGLAVLAFLAIRGYLREAGEDRWSILALPFIVIGSTLFAFLPAMGVSRLRHLKDPTQRLPGRWMRRFGRVTTSLSPVSR